MISSPASTVLTSPAPWRHTFESQVNQNTTQEFTLATVANINGRAVPRARMCGFHGFFPVSSIRQSVRKSLEEEHHLPHSLDSSIFGLESDMLSFSTDSRMEKVDNIRFNDAIEAVFYLRDLSVQWRIKGTAHVIGSSDSDPEEQRSRQEISKGLRKLDPPEEEPDPVVFLEYDKDEVPRQKWRKEHLPWSWEKVMTIYFANHSPLLRGSFKIPSPGRPKSEVPLKEPFIDVGERVHDVNDPHTRKNYRIGVIIPTDVEKLDISDYEKPTRIKWAFVEDESSDYGGDERRGRWEETELWP